MDVTTGQGDEGILEVGRVEVQVVGGHTRIGQGEDDHVGQLPRARHIDVPTVVLDVRHLGKPSEQGIVEGARRHEAHTLLHTGLSGQPLRRVNGNDPALVEECHPVAETLGLVHVVGDEEDRDTAVADRLDELPGVTPGLGIETGGHLVEHGDLGAPDEGEGDRDSLFEPARKRAVVGCCACPTVAEHRRSRRGRPVRR